MSHILDFSLMEINKTALNKSRACKFEGRKEETLARVWEREKERPREITDDESGFFRLLLLREEKKKLGKDCGTEK